MTTKMRECTLPREIVKSVSAGAEAYTGIAMSVTIAGEPVIIMARTIASLDIVFNYTEAKEAKGNANLMKTLRTDACPEVALMRKSRVRFDDEL